MARLVAARGCRRTTPGSHRSAAARSRQAESCLAPSTTTMWPCHLDGVSGPAATCSSARRTTPIMPKRWLVAHPAVGCYPPGCLHSTIRGPRGDPPRHRPDHLIQSKASPPARAVVGVSSGLSTSCPAGAPWSVRVRRQGCHGRSGRNGQQVGRARSTNALLHPSVEATLVMRRPDPVAVGGGSVNPPRQPP